jgi:hypothetical protein
MLPFAVTIFIGAFLLFLVQPMLGKYILPWFGGGSGIWSACLLFFQVGLLAGYAYAHALFRWLSPRRQVAVHLVVLLASLAVLPVVPEAFWRPSSEDDPVGRILLLLAGTVGLPYLALASTGPLMQAWFSRTRPGEAPYRLFALSNAGSLLPLLAYPFLVEPALTRRAQVWAWSIGFGVFALVCGWSAFRLWQAEGQKIKPGNEKLEAVGDRRRVSDYALWFLLPACAVVLLLVSTRQLSEEVAPIPFLWVIPLSTYLITFILCFEWSRLYNRWVFLPALLVACWGVVALMQPKTLGIETQIAGHLAVLFVCCMVCHGELYRLRPHPSRLTSYYLTLAGGGAFGGVFVSVVAPAVFSSYVEYYIAAIACVVLALVCLVLEPGSWARKGIGPLVVSGMLVVTLSAAVQMRHRVVEEQRGAIRTERTFFGVMRVVVRDPNSPSMYTRFEHGRITHGAQIGDPARRNTPTLYFSPYSGIGRLFSGLPDRGPRRVGVVGLGIGTLAAYGRPGDVLRFYELDPMVVRVAEENFSFLSDSAARIELIEGDGRLSLERESPQQYDILVLDAFNADAVPTHLLTNEAFALYDLHLSDGGVIAINVINRYLDLRRVVVPVAEEFGFKALYVHTPRQPGQLISEAMWMILSRDESVLELPILASVGQRPGSDWPRVEPWTDDFASLYSVLR